MRASTSTDVLVPLIRAAATLGFAVAPCSLGFVIIAVSEHLIRSIMVGDDPEMLMSDLQNQFPADHFEPADKDAGLMRKVVELIERPDQAPELPLDVRGTEFQVTVWEALQNVPAGATVSYASLAKQIGAPHAEEEVLRACAANPLAVAIPCHRAVRDDGEMAHYRWGIERKRALLAREAPFGEIGNSSAFWVGRLSLRCILDDDAAAPIIRYAPFFDLIKRAETPRADERIVEAAIAYTG